MSDAGDWVGDWSARRAALSPDRPALTDATTGESWTYAEMDARANRTARLLREFGVADGERVAVVSRNRPELVDLVFACGKTGGVFAPLSHRLAPPELAELFENVDPELVVVEEPFDGDVADAVPEDADVLSLTTDGDHRWDDFGAHVPDDDSPVETPDLSTDDPFMFLHTGGSTGTPKETVLTHGSVTWNATNTVTAWGLRPGDATPMVFPMFHTGGWNVLTMPLFHVGGHVVVARDFDPGEVLNLVEEYDASVLVAVPAVLRMMTEHDDWPDTDLSTLRFAKSGGGPCRRAVMETYWDRGVDLSQGYGLTECGPNNFAMPDGWDREKADSVGVPAMHVDARIVDGDGERVDQGEVGELELRGPHAAAGYWRAPEETADAFGVPAVDDPTTVDADDYWVSTGDLCRVDADGYHYIEGRKKNMFVSGGENVYPPEVEDALADHPGVSEVVVIGVPDDTWGTVGKAIVQGDDSLTVEDFDSFLDGRLARFKHPHHVAFVDDMPTSGPSKIDRDALRERFGGGTE
ncbi:AMP-binding protein [Halobacterium litoreum]|uniref:AMP-binding protein n=1 Tax=Halobacterium litoreum TaxID=2039234 RepID=A0ABD5NBD4_9EURY|nr:AMP-binding protein [Halobacterium litoreum]UHH14530.1 AMP-binding protein [Halobacterium litoreum]